MATVADFQAASVANRNGAYAARNVFVEAARRFESDILPVANGRRGNAKNGMAIDALRVRDGTAAQVLVAGPDEDAALHALLPLLQKG